MGWPATVAGAAPSLLAAYAAVGFLLGFNARRSYAVFIGYRITVGGVLLLLLTSGTMTPT